MLKREWDSLLLAIGFFTRIPVPSRPDFVESDLNAAAKYFPLVGILVGALCAGAYLLALQAVPSDIALWISMAAGLYLTGAFHEDGLADAVDGLGGGFDKERALTIMQDSRIGSYGAIALVMALLGKFLLLRQIDMAIVPYGLIAAHAVSRFAAVMVMATQSYVRPTGKAKPLATRLSVLGLMLAAIFGLVPLVFHLPVFAYALLPVLIVWVWFSLKLRRRLGGYTGDCLGAMQQLTEIAFYIGILIWGRV